MIFVFLIFDKFIVQVKVNFVSPPFALNNFFVMQIFDKGDNFEI